MHRESPEAVRGLLLLLGAQILQCLTDKLHSAMVTWSLYFLSYQFQSASGIWSRRGKHCGGLSYLWWIQLQGWGLLSP